MALTAEEIKANRIARIFGILNCLRPHKAKNRVAKVFQEMVRLEYAAENGGVLKCCTCPAVGAIGENKFDAGHFIPGRRASVIFHDKNCHPQCKSCNDYGGGMRAEYRVFMVETYGEDAVEELEQLGREDHQFTHEQLAELQYHFEVRRNAARKKLKELGCA